MASTEGCSLALPFIEDAPSAVDLPALVDTYSTLLFRIANSVLRSRTEAEDVVQDVFIRVLEHRLGSKAAQATRPTGRVVRRIPGQRHHAGGHSDGGGAAFSLGPA